MKIKTITCHEVYNYGASLQEYALLTFLNDIGHEAQTLHYKPSYLSGHFNLKTVSNPNFDKPFIRIIYLIAKLPMRLKALSKKKAFDKFHIQYIPTDRILYRTNEDLKNNLPNADAFICGSDQIWNSFFLNGRDPAFYLNFVPDRIRKISYAASFAIDNLEESVKILVKENVSRFANVSIRETSGVRILNELGVKDAVQVLDPVFLLNREHWQKFVTPITERFVFVYDFDSNVVIKEIALYLKKNQGYKIYTVNQNIDYADKNFWLEGPEKFLSLVTQSQFNLTNSFHSTAFSILFEKEVFVVNRSEKINTRMRDLLFLMGIPQYLITSLDEFKNLPSINFNEVRKLKDFHIMRSKEFLVSALKE